MQAAIPLAFASILLVTGCASPVQNTVDAPRSVGVAPSTTSVHSYRCESGQAIAATYPSTDSATVTKPRSQKPARGSWSYTRSPPLLRCSTHCSAAAWFRRTR